MQGRVAVPYQVLIQLLTPEPASLHKIRQALATIIETTVQLASNNVKVCIALSAGKSGLLPSPKVLAKLAPIIQQLDYAPVDATPEAWDVLSDSHIAALLPGINHISRLSLARRHGSGSFFALLAKFGNLQQLELHLEDAAGLNHLSVLKGLLEFHLTVTDERQPDIRCGDVLDSNRDSLMHVALTAESWDNQTYMGLMRLSKLRTINLQVAHLRQVNAQALAQLRPSQSMSVTIKKASRLPGVVLHELTSCDVHITNLTLHDPAMVVSWLRAMQHLTTLTLVVSDLTNSVCMSNAQLEGIVQSCPTIQHLSLIKCLQFSSDIMRIILRLKHLHTLCLAHLPGLSAPTERWIEAVIRSQQCVGMAQPQIHVICKWGGHVGEFCVDCMQYPVLCGTDFDEQRATFVQKSWAKIGYPSAQALGCGCMSVASMLQYLPGRAKLYAHAVANSESWEQFEEHHPLGLLIVVAMVGIQVACLYMPVSEPDDDDLHNGADDADVSGDERWAQDNASTVPANNVADLDVDVHPVSGVKGAAGGGPGDCSD